MVWLITADSDITIPAVGTNPLYRLDHHSSEMGGNIEINNERIEGGEGLPISVRHSKLTGIAVRLNAQPR